MIVVDVEASGVNPYKHSLVSVGAVSSTDPNDRFYKECRVWDGAHVDAEALAVNGFTREQVADPDKQTDRELVEKFLAWMDRFDDRTLAGQNPSFDRDFLQATAARAGIAWPLAHRTIDLHSVCYLHMTERGIIPPFNKKKRHSALDLDNILVYCGLPREPEPHHALTGALMEAEAFSRLFWGKAFLHEYEEIPLAWGTHFSL